MCKYISRALSVIFFQGSKSAILGLMALSSTLSRYRSETEWDICTISTARPDCSLGLLVIARGISSVRPSVCLSVTYCVQKYVRLSASGRTIPLVSGDYPDIRRGSPPAGALK